MKAMTKQQLADCAGVTTKTLMSWCEQYMGGGTKGSGTTVP